MREREREKGRRSGAGHGGVASSDLALCIVANTALRFLISHAAGGATSLGNAHWPLPNQVTCPARRCSWLRSDEQRSSPRKAAGKCRDDDHDEPNWAASIDDLL